MLSLPKNIAALFVEADGVYVGMPGVDLWLEKSKIMAAHNLGKGKAVAWLRKHASYQGDDCLTTWPFYRHPQKGYGVFGHECRLYHAPRYMCELVNGPPPTPDHEAAHSCGNALGGCLTPQHLSWKLPADNAADKHEHGTANRRWDRTQRKRHVLTAEQVAEIRSLRGQVTQHELAERFGVSENNIQLILAGKTWKDGTRRTGGFVKGDPNNPGKRPRPIVMSSAD